MTTMIEPEVLTPTTPKLQMCDRPGCDKPATQSYLFDWGEKGVCCDTHAVLLNQAAQQTSRGITLSALRELPQLDLTRDERTLFRAKILTLEEEVEITKGRALELYRTNEQIHKEMRLAQHRAEEAAQHLADATRVNDELRAAMAARDVEHANLVADNERLRLRLDVGDFQGTTVVDGEQHRQG